jgi:3-methyladenine DNA glycosylase AlkD
VTIKTMKRRAAVHPLLSQLRKELGRVADSARAPAMQAYMKSELPFWGVAAPQLRALCRTLFAKYAFESAQSWRADVLALWRGAERREERYAAIALSGQRGAKAFQTLDALPMYEEMIVTGAWWDYVDELAEHRVGPLLAAHPREMRRAMLAWSRSPDMWKRRSSIICQMFFREATDLKLLYACIEPSLSSKEFFLRKAIGWSLRQLAKHDPKEVLRHVKEHDAALSPLSRREALKHLVSS